MFVPLSILVAPLVISSDPGLIQASAVEKGFVNASYAQTSTETGSDYPEKPDEESRKDNNPDTSDEDSDTVPIAGKALKPIKPTLKKAQAVGKNLSEAKDSVSKDGILDIKKDQNTDDGDLAKDRMQLLAFSIAEEVSSKQMISHMMYLTNPTDELRELFS
ncbi:MAG: hypothetical protein LBE97_00740 [Holosporales bacterium]|jgi:hypothetical protein|nr:hypothetical protein [Holosporales bacterium]